ncbi:methyltransferase RsmF C-terminal domain-like protein [Flaviaesturariibacter aridisoli]|uniref:Fmu (Sun) domain protein n=1 Tax=Flaviaesturariibacter aridisoli TaxID=2545761 RepID=A0A4V2WN76_9BACT|nr:Fmu (Sun) domain protein [Flaviaesturariibacter aridisoli]TCZ74462.1 Fmu (Sun) domain protein [Flaviaesturariibacter aridisoli]
MQLPEPLLQSLEGVPGFDRDAFVSVHQSGAQVTSVRFNPAKPVSGTGGHGLPLAGAVPWTQHGYYLEHRPSFTFDPLFHAGTYYVQEASSMFLEQALLQHAEVTQPLRVLDLCAAPGGKSTHLQSLISEGSLLVSNEVIKARAAILTENLTKWGGSNVVVSNNDPAHFARLEGFFDVLVVDAPCSGSGLFRRDPEAIGEWSPSAVQLCQGRQQRILADAWPALRQDGLLLYSTCSYSPEEDESILDWLMETFDCESLPLQRPDAGIVEIRSPRGAWGYRFYPDKIKGEGFFLAAIRKRDAATAPRHKVKSLEMLSQKESAALHRWMDGDGLRFLRHGQRVFAFPEDAVSDLVILQSALYLQSAGTVLGEPIRDKLVPDPALALSPRVSEEVLRCPLDYDNAIRFLQRQDLSLDAPKGWQLATFAGVALGWMNVLPNRVNNYYPREWRIRAQAPSPGPDPAGAPEGTFEK